MHILFLTDNFPPETNAPASRTFEHACEWIRAGHKVTVITCVPNFPKGEVFDGYKNRLWQQEIMNEVRVIRVWSYMTPNEGFVLRTLDFVSFMISSLFAALFVRKPDVIVGTSPQFFTTVAAWAVGAIKRKPFVFELRDIWPESIRAVGAIDRSWPLDLLEKLELFLYHRAAAVVSVTESFKRNLMARGIDENKVYVVTNGVDTGRFFPLPRDSSLATELNITSHFVAGYIGTHGMAHSLGTLLDAAAILQNDPQTKHVRIIFIGEGAARKGLLERSSRMGLTNVIFCGPVSREAVPRYSSLLDIALIHLRRTALFTTVIPSKMFEFMAMGIPILLGVKGEAADIVHKTGVGIIFEPEDPVHLAEQLKWLSSQPQSLEKMSSLGVSAAHRYDRTVLAQSMLKVLETVVNENRD